MHWACDALRDYIWKEENLVSLIPVCIWWPPFPVATSRLACHPLLRSTVPIASLCIAAPRLTWCYPAMRRIDRLPIYRRASWFAYGCSEMQLIGLLGSWTIPLYIFSLFPLSPYHMPFYSVSCLCFPFCNTTIHNKHIRFLHLFSVFYSTWWAGCIDDLLYLSSLVAVTYPMRLPFFTPDVFFFSSIPCSSLFHFGLLTRCINMMD